MQEGTRDPALEPRAIERPATQCLLFLPTSLMIKLSVGFGRVLRACTGSQGHGGPWSTCCASL